MDRVEPLAQLGRRLLEDRAFEWREVIIAALTVKDLQPFMVTVDFARCFTVWAGQNAAVADLDEVIDSGFLIREFLQKCEERHKRLLVV